MTDLEIINALNASPEVHDQALGFLYAKEEYRGDIIAFLRSKGLSTDDSAMLWTDIVVKFALLVRKGKYEHQGKMMGYIKNLSNYMLLNLHRYNKRQRVEELKDYNIGDGSIQEENFNHFELKQLLANQLVKLGADCKNILLYWANGYSMKEIMKKLRFVSPEATRKRKHLCMKKLLSLVDSDQALLNQLKEYHIDIRNN